MEKFNSFEDLKNSSLPSKITKDELPDTIEVSDCDISCPFYNSEYDDESSDSDLISYNSCTLLRYLKKDNSLGYNNLDDDDDFNIRNIDCPLENKEVKIKMKK